MLDIEHLSVRFGGASEAVSDISLSVGEKEKVVLVGETGSGKSVLLLAILQMLPASASVSGRALLDGTDLLTLSPREMNRIRGQRISYVPQGSGNGMNPLLSVGYQVGEPLMIHQNLSKKEALARAVAALRRFDFGQEEKLARQYPHTLSGGMRQRAALIRTLATRPRLLLLDEAFSALDYQTRLAVTDDVYRILKGENITAIMVTHDIPESISMSDRVLVLTRRPAKIKNIHAIDFGPNRSPLACRDDPKFNQYFNLIWKELDVHV